MTLLDTINQMKQQGMDEEQIIQQLREEGNGPSEINQALEQSNIKSALSLETQQQVGGGMQPSIVEQATTEQPAEDDNYMYETPQAYSSYEAYDQYQPSSSETMSDIAEQIAEEKTHKLRKEITEMQNFRTISERKIREIDERLKKIETIIEQLQGMIIGEMGNYGQAVQDIKSEMEMMQDSFSKTLPSLIKKNRESSKPSKKASKRKTSKESSAIEHYLRR